MDAAATGLVEHLRAAWEAGRPVPPFALFDRTATPGAMHATLKAMAQTSSPVQSTADASMQG